MSSRSSSIKYIIVLLVAAFASVAVVFVDAGALAQNTNSSTTMQEDNANANSGTTRRRGRRGRRGTRRAMAENANTGDMTGNENTSDMPSTPETTGMQDTGTSGSQNTGGGAQTDLSGTFTGRINMTGGHEMSGDATFTITGNSFTLESGGMTHSGRIYAVTTRGYTGAALIFTDIQDSATSTPLACSVRVRRGRGSISMTPAPGSRNRLTFTGRG